MPPAAKIALVSLLLAVLLGIHVGLVTMRRRRWARLLAARRQDAGNLPAAEAAYRASVVASWGWTSLVLAIGLLFFLLVAR